VEVVFQPVETVEFNAGLGLLDASYDRLDPGSAASGIELGDPLPNSPDVTLNVGAQYVLPVPERLGSFTVRGDYSWQDDTTFNAPNGEFERQESYGLLGLRGTWSAPGDRYWVALYGTNVTDEEYWSYCQDVSNQLGSAVCQVAAPAEWGLEFGLRYR